MAATIQTIHKPTRARALDTSGNNNHGQIYSGRALEFDGVSDYLTASYTIPADIYTISLWAKFDSTDTGYLFDGRDGSNTGGIGVYSEASSGRRNIIIYQSGGAVLTTAYDLEVNTWYHIVIVKNSGTFTIYSNGVLWATDSGNDNSSNGTTLTFGTRYTVETYLQGKMVNFQVWDAAWSASDALYAYLNPEQLALNRGGTSLTESNLKAWYPMQDGHRGQQSFILDGSNLGVGSEELVTNGSFDGVADGTDPVGNITGWVAYNDSNETRTIDNGRLKLVTTSSNAGIKWQKALTSGTLYKLSCTATGDLGAGGIYISAAGTQSADTTTGVVEAYFTAGSGTDVIFFRAGANEAGTVYYDNISVKSVNAKNHATTVFYGDEEAVNGDMETFPTLHATNDDTFTDESVDGSQNVTMTTDSTTPYAGSKSSKLTMNDSSGYVTYNKTDYVVGRTYLAEVYMRAGTGQTISAFQMFADDSIRGEDGTDGANITPSTSYARAYVQFVATATTMMINCKVTGTNTHYAFIDNFSIKEVGTATGWTDADQQLDIPQTALQSYNQLAWFDGTADYVTKTVSNYRASDSSGSISAWVQAPTSETEGTIFATSDTGSDDYYLNFRMYLGELSMKEKNGDTESEVKGTISINDGKWHHCVLTAAGVGTDYKLYVDGALDTLVTATENDGNWLDVTGDDERNNITIGAMTRTSTTGYWNGAITEVSVWSDDLTLAQIQELYNDVKALDALTHSATANLVGYWRNNGLATWEDLKGSDDLTATSLTETLLLPAGVDSSRDNQGFLMNRQKDTNALNLSGVADYLNFGELTFSGAFTFSAWIYPDSLSGTPAIIGDADSADYIKIYDANTLRFRAANGSSAEWDSGAVLIANTWQYFVLTRASDNTITIYLNGNSHTSNQPTVSGIFAPHYIGAIGTSDYFNGKIDDVKLYDKELSVAEVTRNYNAGKRSHR